MAEIPKEYYLQYAGKTPEQDILADTMSMPFQSVKVFPENAKLKEDKWHNMLIFGDNLQALKHLLKLKNEGKLKNPDGSEGVKLVYIDPPFATKGDFEGSQDQKAYSDKIAGAEFIEFLRKRLILIRELLSEDGSIFVHLDWKKGHYIKVIMDEIFGENKFRNEIVVSRIKKSDKNAKRFNFATDSLYWYSKTTQIIFNQIFKQIEQQEGYYHALDAPGQGVARLFFNKKMDPPKGRHWAWTQDKIDDAIKEKRLRLNPKSGRPEYWIEPRNEQLLDSNWTDLSAYSFSYNYPTEKNESLLKRVIECASKNDDLVLDCFAGSGTTGAIAEKLGRRWIMCDCGKLSIYTIQKRMLALKDDIGSKGKYLKPKPFALYNAGLYDYNLVEKMGEEDYKKFCLELFQCVPDEQEVNGFKMDGVRDNAPVYVFKGKFLTNDFIKSLHDTVSNNLPGKMFIIAPDASVKFFEDWVDINGVKFYILRIPYSIIDEIEKQDFIPLKQPDSTSLLNDIIESVGFDFIEPPEVACEYSIEKPKNKLTEFAQIKIKKFRSNQRSKKEKKVEDEEALSMVLIDSNYDGENFKLTHKFFRDEIEDNIVQFDPDIDDKVAIIYIDIYGNEKIEIVEAKQFKKK